MSNETRERDDSAKTKKAKSNGNNVSDSAAGSENGSLSGTKGSSATGVTETENDTTSRGRSYTAPGEPNNVPEVTEGNTRRKNDAKDWKKRVAAAEAKVALLEAQLAVARRSTTLEDEEGQGGGVEVQAQMAGAVDADAAAVDADSQTLALDSEHRGSQTSRRGSTNSVRSEEGGEGGAGHEILMQKMKEELLANAEREAADIRATTLKQMEAKLASQKLTLEAEAAHKVVEMERELMASNEEAMQQLKETMIQDMKTTQSELQLESESRLSDLRAQVLSLAESEVKALKQVEEAQSRSLALEAEKKQLEDKLEAQITTTSSITEAHSTHVAVLQGMLNKMESDRKEMEAKLSELSNTASNKAEEQLQEASERKMLEDKVGLLEDKVAELSQRSPIKSTGTDTGAVVSMHKLMTNEGVVDLLKGSSEAHLFLGFGARAQYKDVNSLFLSMGPFLAALNSRATAAGKPWVAVFGGDTALPSSPDLGMLMKLIKEHCQERVKLLAMQCWPEVDVHVDHVLYYEEEKGPDGGTLWGGVSASGAPVGGTKFYMQAPIVTHINSIIAIGGGAIATQELEFAMRSLPSMPIWYLQAESRNPGVFTDQCGPVNQWYSKLPKKTKKSIRLLKDFCLPGDEGQMKRAVDCGLGLFGGILLSNAAAMSLKQGSKSSNKKIGY